MQRLPYALSLALFAPLVYAASVVPGSDSGNYSASQVFLDSQTDQLACAQATRGPVLRLPGIDGGVPLDPCSTVSLTEEDLSLAPGVQWTARDAKSGGVWSSMVWQYGRFVSVCFNCSSSANVNTSPDGINWTLRSSGVAGLIGVAWGNGRFCAVSTSASQAASSIDGITWTASALPNANTWHSLAYGAPLGAPGNFVAVSTSGTGNRVITSNDCKTWTPRTSAADVNWNKVAYYNGTFVAVGDGGSIATSSDGGVTWTLRTSPTSLSLLGVAGGNGLWVAVADASSAATTAVVVTSPDAITWTLQNIPTGTDAIDWIGVDYGRGYYIAVGTNYTYGYSVAAHSQDGVTWTYSPNVTGSTTAWDSFFFNVRYGNGVWVASSATGSSAQRFWTSGKPVTNEMFASTIIGTTVAGANVGFTKRTGTGTSTATATSTSIEATDTATVSMTGIQTSTVTSTLALQKIAVSSGVVTATGTATASDIGAISTDAKSSVSGCKATYHTAGGTGTATDTATGTSVTYSSDPTWTCTGTATATLSSTATGTGAANKILSADGVGGAKTGISSDDGTKVVIGSGSTPIVGGKLQLLGESNAYFSIRAGTGPEFLFGSDANPYAFIGTDNNYPLKFRTNNVDRCTLDTSGNLSCTGTVVGAGVTPIGCHGTCSTNYVQKWDGTGLTNSLITDTGSIVYVGSGAAGIGKFVVTDPTGAYMSVAIPSPGATTFIGADSNNTGIIGTLTNNPLKLRVNNVDRVTIDASGNTAATGAISGTNLTAAGHASQDCKSDGTNCPSAATLGGITGSLTTGRMPVATSASALGDSPCATSGNNVSCGQAANATLAANGGTSQWRCGQLSDSTDYGGCSVASTVASSNYVVASNGTDAALNAPSGSAKLVVGGSNKVVASSASTTINNTPVLSGVSSKATGKVFYDTDGAGTVGEKTLTASDVGAQKPVYRYANDYEGSGLTTDSSGSWADVVTLTTTGGLSSGDLVIQATLSIFYDHSYCYARVVVDSVAVGAEYLVEGHAAASGYASMAPLATVFGASGSAHTIKLQAASQSGSTCSVSQYRAYLQVQQFQQ